MTTPKMPTFDFASNPFFASSAKIVTAFSDAVKANAEHSVEAFGRIAKIAPGAHYAQQVTAELSELHTKATARLAAAHQVAADVVAEQAPVLAKHVEDMKKSLKI